MEISPISILVVLAVVAIIYIIYTSNEHGHVVQSDVVLIPETSVTDSPKPAAQAQPASQGQKSVDLFFAPWCGHCKSVVPVWDSLAQKYQNVGNVVKVDCDANPDAAQQADVREFPTIRAYVNNDFVEYNGDRSPQSLENFIVANL